MPFNPDGDLFLKSQDKGSRFVAVDKQADIVKANHQIERSIFVKLNKMILLKSSSSR